MTRNTLTLSLEMFTDEPRSDVRFFQPGPLDDLEMARPARFERATFSFGG